MKKQELTTECRAPLLHKPLPYGHKKAHNKRVFLDKGTTSIFDSKAKTHSRPKMERYSKDFWVTQKTLYEIEKKQ